jgi:hypothetical protein
MELRDAVDRISAIRSHLAATERLRGLGAKPVAASAAVGALAAMAQHAWCASPAADPFGYVGVWLGASLCGAGIAALAVALRLQATASPLVASSAAQALRVFAPIIAFGLLLTAAVVVQAPQALSLLPGLWQLLYAMALWGARRLLPSVRLVAAFFVITGATCLWLGDAALAPLAMGLPFAVGQCLIACLLRDGSRNEVVS